MKFPAKFYFPAFFSKARYERNATEKLVQAMIDLSDESANPNAPIFSSVFEYQETPESAPIMMEFAAFPKRSTNGTPYFSCSVKKSERQEQSRQRQGQAKNAHNDSEDDDIPF